MNQGLIVNQGERDSLLFVVFVIMKETVFELFADDFTSLSNATATISDGLASCSGGIFDHAITKDSHICEEARQYLLGMARERITSALNRNGGPLSENVVCWLARDLIYESYHYPLRLAQRKAS